MADPERVEKTVTHEIDVYARDLTLRTVFDFCQQLIDDNVEGDHVFRVDGGSASARTKVWVTETKEI